MSINNIIINDIELSYIFLDLFHLYLVSSSIYSRESTFDSQDFALYEFSKRIKRWLMDGLTRERQTDGHIAEETVWWMPYEGQRQRRCDRHDRAGR